MSNSKKPPFSIRTGARQTPVLGMRDMPESLRVALWNTFAPWFLDHAQFGSELDRRFHWIYSFHATNWPVDEAYSATHVKKRLKDWFMTHTWDSIYDFIEAVPNMVWYGLYDPDPEQF
jgi:AbiJ N-terminal domain 4